MVRTQMRTDAYGCGVQLASLKVSVLQQLDCTWARHRQQLQEQKREEEASGVGRRFDPNSRIQKGVDFAHVFKHCVGKGNGPAEFLFPLLQPYFPFFVIIGFH